jgi:DNA repair protein RecN (Recombination protein N)
MLKNLVIKNFAIIEEIEIDFDDKLNIIIGETGAGKSIIIDSLSILLGDKASPSLIRSGEKKAIIEGTFNFHSDHFVWNFLRDNDFELDDDINSQLIIRREISTSGNSRSFINDTPVPFSLLQSLGEIIIDFHGQYEHQLLLNSKNHILIIDAFANNFDLLKRYKSSYYELKSLIKEFEIFKKNSDLNKQQIELYKTQLSEITSVNPKINEDEELQTELKTLENSEVIFSNINEVLNDIYNSDNSLFDTLVKIEKKISLLGKFQTSFAEHSTEISRIKSYIKELASKFNDFLQHFEFQPERIELINQRLFQIQNLKRKHGSIQDILDLKKSLEEKLSLLSPENDKEITYLRNINEKLEILKKIALQISQKRKQIFNNFSDEIEKILKELGFAYINFQIKHSFSITENETDISFTQDNTNYKLLENGIDLVSFVISTNAGETPKELVKIASGGEISRIMLGLKSLAANDANLPILVFDEIDSGVSGKVAQKVGLQMRKLSNSHQIICITHTPQVAAAGTNIIYIEKIHQKDKTISTAKVLNNNEKEFEIAKFLSGSTVSGTSLEAAKELINFFKI